MKSLLSVAAIPPQLKIAQIARALLRDFGLTGELHSLVSERDQNFRLDTADNSRYVVKIVSLQESQATTDFQIAALLHLEKKGLAGVPRVVHSLSAATCSTIAAEDGSEYTMRVVSWVPGRPMADKPLSASLARQLGTALAQLDDAFADFCEIGDNPVLLWDMQRAAELLDLTSCIDVPAIRQIVEQVLTNFRDCNVTLLQRFPRQAIHNDVNPSNVLAAESGTRIAFIDFGDMLHAPRIVEIATSASYLRSAGNRPLQFIAPFVAAYHARNPLTAAEIDLLFDLIQTRLAMTISILYWRMSARDAGDAYRQQALRTESNAVEFLQAMEDMGRDRFCQRLRRALQER